MRKSMKRFYETEYRKNLKKILNRFKEIMKILNT